MNTKIITLITSIIIGTSILPPVFNSSFRPEITVSIVFGVVMTVIFFWKEINNN